MFIPSSLASRGPRLLTTFVIFALSSGVVGGVIFYLDWTSPQVFQAGVKDVPVDMQLELSWGFYQQNTTSIENITAIAREQEYVTGTETVSFIQTWDSNQTDERYSVLSYLGIEGSFFDTFENALQVAPGTPTLNDSTCYVQGEMLVHWGVDVGRNVSIYFFTYDEHGYRTRLNYTLMVVGTFSSQLFIEQLWPEGQTSTLRVVTTRQALTKAFGNMSKNAYEGPRDQIWIALDRTALTRGGAATAADELDNVRKRIEQRALPYASVPYDGFKLLDAVVEFSAWSSGMRTISLCASLPAIIMGIMLVHYDSNLTADQRRRDTGTLKTRGASGWQTFSWILTAALFTAIIGSIGALITGYFAAALSGTVRTLLEFRLSQFQAFAIIPLPESVVFVFLFSFGVGLLVALPSAVRGLLMSATEAHATVAREDLSTPEKPENPWVDLIALAVSAYVLMGVVFSLAYLGDITAQASLTGILMPFLAIFMFTFARLLSRPTAAVEARVLSWLRRPSLLAGAAIVGRNLSSFRKTQSLGVMFVSMVFAAGIFSGVSATTGYNHMSDILMFQAGADIRVDVSAGKENVTLSILGNITAVTGIDSAAAMLSTTGNITYYQDIMYGLGLQTRSIRIFGVQALEWYQSAFWLPYFAYSGNPGSSLQQVAQSNSSVITSFRPVVAHADTPSGPVPIYGDSLTLSVKGSKWVNQSTCTIVDVLGQDLDGYRRTYFTGEPDVSSFVIINLRYLQSCLRTLKVETLYIHLLENANYTRVIHDLYSIAPDSFKVIDSGLKRIDDALVARAGSSIFGVYTLNLLFSLIYLTMGIAIVSVERVRKLRRQLSVFRALGGQTRSVTVSIILETTVGLLLAASIGGLLGLVLSSLIMTIPLVFFGTGTSTLWPRLPIQLAIPTQLLLSIVALAFLCTLCTTYIVTKKSLTKNIAEEIQVEE